MKLSTTIKEIKGLLAKRKDSSFRKQKTIEQLKTIKYINSAVAKSTAERGNSKRKKAQYTPTSVFFIVYLLTHLSFYGGVVWATVRRWLIFFFRQFSTPYYVTAQPR